MVFRDVLVKGFVDEVAIICGASEIARHPRVYGRGQFVFDPKHYLALLEQKPGALDQAAPLQNWTLPELMRRHSDTLILTDVCVPSTALGAIDHGYRVIIAEDAVCSSSDQGHDFLLALFAQRFSQQIEVADAQMILTAWAFV